MNDIGSILGRQASLPLLEIPPPEWAQLAFIRIPMKTCRKCGNKKTNKEFYKDNHGSIGLSTYCKVCTKLKLRIYYKSNSDSIKARVREYYAKNRDTKNKKDREYYAKNIEARRAKNNAYNRANPIPNRVTTIVQRAISRGDLVRPNKCERCGKGRNIEAHHEDYDKPLSVEWLCKSCHRRHHGAQKGES